MNPWEVLGLDEDETDPRTIKRAYARELKRHRPDDDPEGFQRVREAYEYLRSGAVHSEYEQFEQIQPNDVDEPLDPVEVFESPEPVESFEPPEFLESVESPVEPPIADPIAEAAEEGDDALYLELARLAERARTDPSLVPQWEAAVVAHAGDRPALIVRLAQQPEELRASMTYGDGRVVDTILRHARSVNDLELVEKLAVALAHEHAAYAPAARWTLIEIAEAVAFTRTKTASDLAEIAYGMSPDDAPDSVDRLIAASRDLEGSNPDSWRTFGLIAMGCKWNTHETDARKAARAVAGAPLGGALRDWLTEAAPDLVRAARGATTIRERRRVRQQTESGGMPVWSIVIGIVFALSAIRGCGDNSTPSTNYEAPDERIRDLLDRIKKTNSPPDDRKSTEEWMDELEKKRKDKDD